MHAPFYNSNLGHLGEAAAGGSEGTAALGLGCPLTCIVYVPSLSEAQVWRVLGGGGTVARKLTANPQDYQVCLAYRGEHSPTPRQAAVFGRGGGQWEGAAKRRNCENCLPGRIIWACIRKTNTGAQVQYAQV